LKPAKRDGGRPAGNGAGKAIEIDRMEVGYTMSQAVAEAARCLLCHDPPCSKGCPAGTDPGTFIWKLRMRNVKGAIRTIKENNILGAVCGVACPVERLCQKGCSAAGLDRPIEIGKLQRFLVEHAWACGFDPLERGAPRRERVAIVGSGPAGLACAAALARAGVQATIFESRERAGGVLRYGVPRFRLHDELLDRELEDVKKLGVELKLGVRVREADELFKKRFDAVFVAPGLWQPRRLRIPGAELRNVATATELLGAARVDAASVQRVVRRKNVAVIGGGSVAMDVANTCKALGAGRVYCICLEGPAEIPADRADLELALANGVVIKPHAQVTELLGKGDRVVGLRGNETEWVEPGSLLPSNARAVPGTEFGLKVELVVFAIGSSSEAENRTLAPAKKDGLFKVKRDGVSTTNPRLFAGGDATRGPALIVDAIADGKAAAGRILAALGVAQEVAHG
jgi:NADPH-dependent glutamate synthase beta subunit-like oxidoreductase